jgi:hypothetical protein
MTRINPDPIPAIATALRAYFLLPSTVAIFNGAVRVAEEDVPTDWNLRSDPPVLVVYDDGGPVFWPYKRDPTIRFTARARGKPVAKLVAAHAEGYLREHIPGGLAHIRRGGSSFLVTTDSATGADLASFTLPAVVPTIETV